MHPITLSPAPDPGHWLKLTLGVTGKDSGRSAELTIWVGHQPLDVNQNGATTSQDATAFGNEFRGGRSTVLIDTNGDGLVNVQDATAFGNNWNGEGTSQAWANTNLPPKP